MGGRFSRRPAWAAGLLLAALAATARAGELHVQVRGGDAAEPLDGATVELRGPGVARSGVSGDGGLARFDALPAGSYRVQVTLDGYSGVRFDGVSVPADGAVELPVRLVPDLRERVRVSGRRPPVVLDETANTTKFSDDFIQSLPVENRFLQNALTLAPGVLDSDDDGNPNVHGARAGDFKVLIDGVSNTDPLTGEYLSFVNLESVEELEVITAGAGVEYGRAQGGFASVLQKQGSDELEGVAGFIWRSEVLDGDGAADLRDARIPEFEWFQPFVQLSGPIVRGKLWYRLSHEYVERDDPINTLGQLAVTRRRQTIHSDQLTWQVSDRDKLALSFLLDPLRLENLDVSSTVPEESTRTVERGGPTYTVKWSAQRSPRLLVESLAAWQNHRLNTLPTRPGVDNTCLFSDRFGALAAARCFYTNSGLTSGSYPIDSRDRRQRFTVRSDAILYPRFLARWSPRIKLGFVIENERYRRRRRSGTDVTWSTQNVGVTPFNPTGRIGFATALVPVPETTSSRAVGTSWGLYAEAQLRPRSGLVLTAGLRLDRDAIDARGFRPFDPQAEARAFLDLVERGVPQADAAARTFTAYEAVETFPLALARALDTGILLGVKPIAAASVDWDHKRVPENVLVRHTHLSPRFALAWDPASDGKTKLSVSAGRYYDKLPLAVPLVELEPPVARIGFVAFPLGRLPRQLFSPWRESSVRGGVDPTAIVRLVDRDLRTPYQDELAVTFERELWNETQLKLTWLRRRFRDQLQDLDINHLPGDFGRCLPRFLPADPALVPSPGSGQTLTDPFSGETYVDSDPGDGDGRLDDCSGAVLPRFTSAPTLNLPDGLPDLYLQNPAWGDVLLLGNFNSADYEAFVLEFVRRYWRGWQMNGSYTWSMARGDAERFDQDLGNDRALLLDATGFLSFDQRHVVKLNAAVLTRWGIRLGGAIRWESGLPFSTIETATNISAVPPAYAGFGGGDAEPRLWFPSGRRNDRRNPSFWNFDIRAAREFRFGSDGTLALTAEVFNLLNDGTLRVLERVDGQISGVRRFGRQYQVGLRIGF